EQERHARDVAVVLAGLVGAAGQHVVDALGRHARALEQGADGVGQEVVGADLGEGAAVAADGRPDGVDDEGVHAGKVARNWPAATARPKMGPPASERRRGESRLRARRSRARWSAEPERGGERQWKSWSAPSKKPSTPSRPSPPSATPPGSRRA